MTVLVTGGTGSVGGAIVRALVEQGETVRVLARRTSRTHHLELLNVEIAYGDIFDTTSIESALDGCDTLFHAAAMYDLWGLNEEELTHAAVDGTRNVLNAALSAGVDKVVYTSTAATIGEPRGEVGTEETVHRGYFLSKYEKAKFEAEKVAGSYLDRGLSLVMVIPSQAYGPGDFKPSGRFVMDYVNGRFPGLSKGIVSLVYLDDVGRSHVLAASKGKVGERYIVSGDIVSIREVAALLSRLSGARVPPTFPDFMVGIHSYFGEAISRFTKRPPLLSIETFRGISHGLQVDGSRAATELGIEYTPLEDGARRAIIWYWQQGLLKREPVCAMED